MYDLTDPEMAGKSGFTFSNNSMVFLSLIFLVAFGAAEFAYYYVSPLAGIIFYLINLFGLIAIAAVAADQSQRGLWLALGLVPLMRIVSSVMPSTTEISRSAWYVLVSVPTIIAVFGAVKALKYGLNDIGLNLIGWPIQALVSLNGIGLAVVDYLILRPGAWTSDLTIRSILLPAVVLLLFTGFLEELVFRGLIRRAFEMIGPYGSVYAAAVYAVLQIGQGSVLHLIFTFAVGLFFGWIVKKTGSIFGVGLSHGLINIAMYLLLPHLF